MNLIRYYNQNRKKIWGIVIIIASAILLLHLMNYIYEQNRKKELTVENTLTTNVNTNTTTVTANKSVVTGESLSTNQLQTATEVIDNFISYCNNKELEKAYGLLTEECKKQMYDSLEVFEQAYYNNIFNGESKNCTVENWIGDTYKVKIADNLLATGKANEGYSKQDYITVKKIEDEYKLNINNYIGYTEINETTNQNDITMEVIGKNTYIDYEEYTIKVTNNTENTILLDGRSNAKSLYLQDSKENAYSSYSHELTEPALTISSGQTKEVTIKFYSSYISTKKIQYIVFSDLLLYDGQLSEQVEFRAKV